MSLSLCNGGFWSHNKMSCSVGHCYSSSTPRHHYQSKFRNPINGYRRRRYRKPGTPLTHWKYNDEGHRSDGGVGLSARKLAAGLWQLRLFPEISSGGGKVNLGTCDWLRFQPPTDAEHVNIAFPWHRSSRNYGVKPRDHLWQSPVLNYTPNHKILHKHKSSFPYPKSAMEEATKWNPMCSKNSTEAYYFFTHMKLLEDQAVTTVSVVSALQAEVVQARLRILQLEDEHRSCKKRFEHLMRKLGEEKKSRRSREHHKVRAVMDDFKDELSTERKTRKKIEILNSKLVKELADNESAAKQLVQEYEKEKKGREIMEEVCNELAKKIRDDKTELDVLKCEAMKIRQEVEEERRMLQLAEIWREERVQMKLVDAKSALEYKYNQMNKLVVDLESFLSSQSQALDITELRKAELIRQAVKSVNIHDFREFEYVPPKSSGIFSIFKQLEQGDADEREIEPLVNYSPVGDASNYQIVCHKANEYNNNYELVECDENGGRNSPNTEINEVCSGGQLKQKASSVYKPRSSSKDGNTRLSDSKNPHIMRGMKGFIEWPRGNQKNGLKLKLLKALLESQKSKFRAMS